MARPRKYPDGMRAWYADMDLSGVTLEDVSPQRFQMFKARFAREWTPPVEVESVVPAEAPVAVETVTLDLALWKRVKEVVSAASRNESVLSLGARARPVYKIIEGI